MSSKCSVLRDLTHLSQLVDDFLSNPGALNNSSVNFLISRFLSVQGAAQALPIKKAKKCDILHRFAQAISILQSRDGLSNINIILAISQILQTIRLKIEDLCIPCPQGIVTVHPSNTFNTSCKCCKC